MKSFSQFLEESYLNEGVAPSERRPARKRRSGGPTPEEVKAGIDKREAEQAAKKAQRKPSGAAARSDLQFKSTKVQSPTTPKKPSGAARDVWKQFPGKAQKQYGLPKEGPSTRLPGRTLEPAGGTTPKPSLPGSGQTQRGGQLAIRPTTSSQLATRPTSTSTITKPQKPVEVKDVTNQRRAAADIKARRAAAGTGPSGKSIVTPPPASSGAKQLPAGTSGGKPPSGPKIKVPSGLAKAGKVAGKILGPAAAALDVADEKAKGSGWARSLAKGAAVAAGGALGGAAGSIAGPVGSIGGATVGSMAASKAFDVAAGANAKERKAMATANRQKQSGTAIKGIGGPTSFDTKKNTMTTGSGSQRKTVALAKTGVVQRGGQSVAGNLAYKGGKAVYKAGPSAQSLAKTSSNPLERIGRSLFAGAYKQHDAAKAKQALSKARQSDAARNKALGVKALPGK